MDLTKKVKLGGREYTIHRLTMKANQEWRAKLDARLLQLAGALKGLGTDESMTGDIAVILQMVSTLVLKNIDALIDLLFEFSPELAANREQIENEAYDEEAFEALQEVVRWGIPLESISKLLPGLPGMGIGMSLPLPNGANGTSKSKAGHRAATK